jgi:hypothetical protein
VTSPLAAVPSAAERRQFASTQKRCRPLLISDPSSSGETHLAAYIHKLRAPACCGRHGNNSTKPASPARHSPFGPGFSILTLAAFVRIPSRVRSSSSSRTDKSYASAGCDAAGFRCLMNATCRRAAGVPVVHDLPGVGSTCRINSTCTRSKQARSPDIQFHLGLGSGIEAGVAAMKNPGVTLNSAFLRPRPRGTVRYESPLRTRRPLR